MRASSRGAWTGEGELDAHPSAKAPLIAQDTSWGVRGAPQEAFGPLLQFLSRPRRPPALQAMEGGEGGGIRQFLKNSKNECVCRMLQWGNFAEKGSFPKVYQSYSRKNRNRRRIVWMLSPAFEKWATEAASYFGRTFGLSGPMALDAARLYVAFWAAGLNPRISRGFSDPAHQKALQARWDAGDRAGLRVRPATNSKHTIENWLGNPAAEAIDMPTSNDEAAAKIAANLRIGTGWNFTSRDPGHYFHL